MEDYFGLKTLELIVKQLLGLTNTTSQYDIWSTSKAAVTGQAGAIRHVSAGRCTRKSDTVSASR